MKYAILVLALFSPVQNIDDALQRMVQEARQPALEKPMSTVSKTGRILVFAGLLAVATYDAAAGPATAKLAIAALIPTNLAVEGLKRATFRARPDGEHKRSNASFPSSHAANAFAIAWVLGRRYRKWAWALWSFAAVVAFSRVYLNRHYVSDVLVGAAVGVLCAWGAARFMSWWASRKTSEKAT